MKIKYWIILVFVLPGCHRTSDYEKILNDPDLYCQTVHELNTIVMGNNFSPMVASRNYLYAAVAGYEVIAAANPGKFNSLAGQLRGLPAMPKPAPDQKINFNLAALLAYCKLGEAVTFPAGSMKYWVDSLIQLANDHGMPENILNNTIAFGDTVSSVIMEWSKKIITCKPGALPNIRSMILRADGSQPLLHIHRQPNHTGVKSGRS